LAQQTAIQNKALLKDLPKLFMVALAH